MKVFAPMKWQIVIRKGEKVCEEAPFIQDLLFVCDSRQHLDSIVERNQAFQYRWLRNTYWEPMTVSNSDMKKFMFAVSRSESPKYYLPEEITPQIYRCRINIQYIFYTHMNFCKNLFLAAFLLFLGACSTSKEISYFQDLRPGESELTLAAPVEIKIQPKDKLSILVNSQDPRLTNLFNLPIFMQQIGQEANTNSSRGISGYTVDTKGYIDFPVLGNIQIAGMTREEVASHIKSELQSHDLIKDPVVTVEYMNLSIAVMGEVKDPGRYNIDKDNLTILDALSRAGDLTIFGKREKVLVLRNENGKQRAYGVNLCSAEHLYTSPVYYLQQNDVVYVEPNDTKARQSTVNGNNVRSTSFWISLASLLTSIALLIAK